MLKKMKASRAANVRALSAFGIETVVKSFAGNRRESGVEIVSKMRNGNHASPIGEILKLTS